MTSRFFITIDTEEDEWGEYRASDHSVENIRQISQLQALFDCYGAIPTYLVTYPVIKNAHARALLLEILSRNRCEIGTHCHPWNTPPFGEELNERNSMLCNLPYSVVVRKIETLHGEITESLGVTPRCFRAGRWGFGPHVAEAIHNLGYQVDTSVTPFVDWGIYKGPDYRDAPQQIYRFNPDAMLAVRSAGALLQVPVTIGFVQKDFERCRLVTQKLSGELAARLHLKGILDRARVLNFRWLSPELSNGRDMVALAKTILRRGCSHLSMSFHSTSLLPGKSPYVRTQKDLGAFLKDIEQVLRFAANERLVFSTLSELLEESPAGPVR